LGSRASRRRETFPRRRPPSADSVARHRGGIALMFSRLFVCFAAVLLAHGTMSAGPLAPKHARGAEPLPCDDNEWRGDGRASHCEIRETKIADFGGSVDVDSGMNGGIAVIGWDQPGAFVRARI